MTAHPGDPHAPRTRGPLITAAVLKETVGPDGTTLEKLMKALRHHVGGLPLTIVIHGWGHEAITSFLDAVGSIRDPKYNDAVWIVMDKEPRRRQPEERDDIVLSFNYEADQLIYDNLIIDIAYVAAIDAKEIRYVRSLARRCGVLLIHEGNDQVVPLVHEADKQGVTACLWSGARVTEFSTGKTKHLMGRRFKTPDMGQFASLLLQHARYLGDQPHTRRLNFQALLEQARAFFPDMRNLKAKLVEHAEANDWPLWAVDSLGPFYLPLGTGASSAGNAYVWHYVASCIPARLHVRDVTPLCKGRVRRMHVPKAAVSAMETLAAIFDEEVGHFEYGSDGAFIGAVNHAMTEAGIAFGRDKQAKRKIDKARQLLLQQHDIPASTKD